MSMSDKSALYWPISEDELRTIPNGEKFVCMFSGGKDSGLALSVACSTGEPIGLIHCLDDDTGNSLYHEQSYNLIQVQAKCIGLPITILDYSGWHRKTKLVHYYKKLASEGVQSVVFGDIHIDDNARTQAALCISGGLKPRMPLWHLSNEIILQNIIKRRIISVITVLRSKKLDVSMLGKIFDQKTYKEMLRLNLDPLGEMGEFHSTLVDGDIFNQPLSYFLGDIEEIYDGKRIVVNVNK